MNKRLFLVGALLAGAVAPGFGQGRDTVFAVRKLFREKRAAGQGLQAAGSRETSDAKYVGHSPPTAQEARQDALGNTAFYLTGAAKATRYSAETETAIIRSYEAGNPIPADIRRKLKRRYFHRTARDLGAPQ